MVWNKRMLTTEDANSILYHFGKGFCDYYVLDTRDLTTVDTWFAYDFIDVYRVTGSISFNVKNSLWTGGFRVIDSNIGSPRVSVSGDSIVVTGTGLEWVILVLELSPEFNYGEIFELDYQVEYTPVIRPFYEDIALTMGFLDGETPVTGMTVTDKITGETLTTDSSGLVSVISPLAKHGDFDYILEAANNGHTVDYNFPYTRVQCELPVVLVNPVLYRDKLNLLTFKFLFDDEYNITEDMLFEDNRIRLRANGVFYDVKEYNTDSFSFEVPLGLKDYADLHFIINGNDYLEDYTLDYSILTSFVTCEDSSDLKSELEGDNPAGTVYYTGAVLDETITVSNDVRLVFDGLVECSLDSVFTVTNGAGLVLDNVSFTGKNLVNISDGSVTVKNSSFQHCTDTIITGTGSLSVETSSFTDNYSCLDIDGSVVLRDTLFDLSDTEYLDTVKPAFIRCFKDLTVDYCQFNLDLHELTSLGLSYVMFFLGKNGTVNTVANKTLMKNEVFPTAKNTGTVDVESEHYHITSKNNKCMIWTLQDTNTVYSNYLNVEYIEED